MAIRGGDGHDLTQHREAVGRGSDTGPGNGRPRGPLDGILARTGEEPRSREVNGLSQDHVVSYCPSVVPGHPSATTYFFKVSKSSEFTC